MSSAEPPLATKSSAALARLPGASNETLLLISGNGRGALISLPWSQALFAFVMVLHLEAIYVHYYVHPLNVALCHTCKALEILYIFFNRSLTNHKELIVVQKELGINHSEQLSDTRWGVRYIP